MNILKKYEDHAYAALRFMTGWMFAFHGAQKILGLYPHPSMPPIAFPSQIWWGGMIELIGGLMIAIGLRTREAAFLSSGTMAVAYAQFHWKFQFNSMFWPSLNQGEPAVVYCFVFLLIACRGTGRWGLEKGK
ncbi:MAG: DoxX family protein [Elusimicrobia bacterium]|nr:DoxX family protein [Elusimicrobiota bacterium]